MAVVGYARVSTIEQNLDIQMDALKQAGCTKIFSEKYSGASKRGRKQLEICLDYLREGDTLVVTRIDRLARSVFDLQGMVRKFEKEGVLLKATEQPVDTGTAAGKAFFDMLAVFAEFEYNLRKERQLEGIAKAQAEGKYKGRKPTARAKLPEIKALLSQGMSKAEAAKKTGVSRASVYRILNEAA